MKLDYLFFHSKTLPQASERQLLKNQSEEEWSHTHTYLLLPLEKPCLAGFLLIENWSRFLETDGNSPWVYHRPLVHAPPQTMNQCYDRILIVHEDQIQFVDPFRRQKYPAAHSKSCTHRTKNLFQVDMDQKDSWYTLIPGIVHQDKPAVFGLKMSHPFQFILFLDPKLLVCAPELNLAAFETVHLSVPLLEMTWRYSCRDS